MGQTKNIFNFNSMKDYKVQAIDPMLSRIDEIEADGYGAANAFKSIPDRLKPFVNPIYLPGGNLNQSGSGAEGWANTVNRPMPQSEIDAAKAAIAKVPGNAFHVRDFYRRRGYDVSPLGALPGG
jgi:hypothetical protein